MNFLEQRARSFVIHLPSNHDLPRLAQTAIGCDQKLRHSAREMRNRRRKCIERFLGAIFELLVVPKLRQPQKIKRSNRARSRFGAVVIVFHAQDDTLVFAAGRKIAAVLFVEEQTILRFLKLNCELQPFDVERRFVKIEKSLDHERVVVRETLDRGSSLAIVSEKRFSLLVRSE